MSVGCILALLLAGSLASVRAQEPSSVSSVVPTSRPPILCMSFQATCNNGDCIDRSKVCDGAVDCSDGSDESGCRPFNVCEPNEYQCRNKKCVLKTWRCDGDDDCGDGSDESNCQENPPNSPCRYYEWQCASRDQCIPKSFHCDGEMDCQDQSDEIGCTGPVIVESPPPTLNVEQSYTFVINCTAMGIPTPEIVWRLNWGHVPDKCTMTSVSQGGNRAYGELTCPAAVKKDSGAYSCEAINSMGSCFAGSAGCGQPGQDAIVIISGVPSNCPDGTFNGEASVADDCIRCDCSGLTDSCSSAELYFSQLPPPDAIFQLVTRNPFTMETKDVRQVLPKSSTPGRLYLPIRSIPTDGVTYFAMPPSHTGNQLKSYGGYIRLSLSYQGNGNPLKDPHIIIQGKEGMLTYFHSPVPRAGVDTRLEARLWPGQWFTDYRGNNLATRTDILRVLKDIQYLLIRAQQVDGAPIDTTVSNLVMDTADSRDTGARRIWEVEQCLCPPGYTGLSCETCAPGYDETSPGVCRRPAQTCPTGYYADPDNGECLVCPCPLTTPSNQFGRSCSIDSDRQVTCDCATGYSGRRCGDCAPGFVGNPAVPGGSCTPGPVCNYPQGSSQTNPDPITGQCRCKAGYTGASCSKAAAEPATGCPDFTFLSREESAPGCIQCFCNGVPTGTNRTSCQPSQLYRFKETAVFQEDILGFSLTDTYMDEAINGSELILTPERQELSYDRFDEHPDTVFYWRLPYQFLGNKLTSYGGFLEFSLRYTPAPGAEESGHSEPLVQIEGNEVSLLNYSPSVVKMNDKLKFKVRIHEDDWERDVASGGKANREHLLMALASLDHILIRATQSNRTREAGISDVSLDCGVNRTTEAGTASAVEGCICPTGYKGLSCEECAPGYTKTRSGLYLGTCEPCSCNGKSSTCDPDDGVCLDCRDYTTGDNCEYCLEGYIKDPASGGCIPLEGSEAACACDPRGSLDAECVNGQYCQCKENVEGVNCDRCKSGTFGLTSANAAGCSSCHCSGVTDECSGARLFWSTLRLNSYDKKYVLTDRSQRIVKDQELRYNARTSELVYQMQEAETGTDFYWRLPQEVTGNKLGAYGGNLTIIQRYRTSNRGRVLVTPDVVISGGGRTLIHAAGSWLEEGPEVRNKVALLEDGWTVEETGQPATRQDMLAVLADIQTILVRASIAEGTVETAIRKTMMDIGVPQMTGGPMVEGAEECRCPTGYAGFSCESCSVGYYRDGDRCLRCPCQGKEESCRLLPDGRVECRCRAGFSGQACEYRGNGGAGWPGPVDQPGGGVAPGPVDQPGGVAPGPVDQPSGGAAPPIQISMTEPRIQIVEVGKTVRFNCDALPTFRTQEPTTIAWAKDNGILPADRSSQQGNGLLIISSVRSEDSGTYICTATTGRFVTTDRALLKVASEEDKATGLISIPPGASIEPNTERVNVGDRLEIECTTFGMPAPVVTWYRNNRGLRPQVRVSDKNLYIDAVRKEDEGEYTCLSQNVLGMSEAKVQVYVDGSDPAPPGPQQPQPPPVWPQPPQPQRAELQISPQDVMVAAGATAVFDCSVSGARDYALGWSRDNRQPLPYSSVDPSGGRLTLTNVGIDDTGIYICRATGPSGDVLDGQARLVVSSDVGYEEPRPGGSGGSSSSGPPTVTIQPEEQTIGQGANSQLRCLGSGNPAPTLTWSKVGEDLTSPNIVVNGGLLSLSNAAVSDRGMYICNAENAGGSARASAIIEVERRERPRIEIYPDTSQTITVSGSVLFQCRAVGGIPTPSITWSRVDGRPLHRNAETMDGGVLRINQVTGDEQGQYVCKAENEVGSVETVASLIIQEIPSITLDPRGSVNMQVGQKLSINCNARGDPTPTISWKKVGGTSRDLGISGPVYEVASLTKEDEGTYACVASNVAGQSEERVQIIVMEPEEYFAYPQNGGGGGGQEYPTGAENNNRYPGGGSGRYPGQVDGSGRYPSNQYPDSSGRYPDNGDGRYPGSSDNGGQQQGPSLDVISTTKGANVEFDCRVVGSASNAVTGQWRRADGARLPTRHYQNNGILNLVDVDENDVGKYICDLTDPRGNSVLTIEKDLGLGSLPIISLEPRQQVVSLGERAMVTCSVQGSLPISINWTREDGASLPASVIHSQVSETEAILQIPNISARDQGRYVCSAFNPVAEATATAQVTLNEYGGGGDASYVDLYTSNSEPERITASIGASVELSCRLAAGGSAGVRWAKEGGQLPDSASQIDTTLRIGRVTDRDSGKYVCSSPTGSQTVILTVQRTNTYRSVPKVRVTASIPRPYVGGQLDLTCEVENWEESGPAPRMSWSKVNSPQLPTNVRSRDNLIRFIGLTSSNMGMYRCQAETTLGTFYDDYYLQLQGQGRG